MDGSTTDAYFSNPGNVGIGTTSPSAKLHVNGGIKLSDDQFLTWHGSNTRITGQAGYMQFQIAATDAMRITSTGVGIGTTSPSYKLDVAGDLRVLSSSINYQENTDVDTGTETVATVNTGSFDGAFFDYLIKSGSNLRAGTVTAIHDGTNVEYNEVSTQDLGSTTAVELSVDISGADMRLRATTTSDDWLIKSLVRTL